MQDRLVMVDLFSGLGGASQAMVDRGWTVYRVEIEAHHRPTVVADVRNLPIRPPRVDLLWASPPCTEYSRTSMRCWYPEQSQPDHTLYRAARAAIGTLRPTWWVIENVCGAIKWWQEWEGHWSYHFGSHFLWTNLPILSPLDTPRHHAYCPNKPPGVSRASWRAKIPYEISLTVAEAVELLQAR